MKISISFLAALVFCVSSWAEEPVLNVYHWFNVIPASIIKQFEHHTGIHVNFDVYDSNEILEAKLLTGTSGYDLVGPSAFPFLAQQIAAGIYQPLQKDQLTCLDDLDPRIMDRLAEADPGNRYAIPLEWGLVGLAYNAVKIQQRLQHVPAERWINSWALLYDPTIVQYIADDHIALLEESNEVIVPLLIYLTMRLDAYMLPELNKVQTWLQRLRPYISRFDATRSVDDLFSGQLCVACHWVSTFEHRKAIQGIDKNLDHIHIVVPKEGTLLWIDALAIPKSAPHPKNAHRFINFLMQPEIIAQITNHTHCANAVVSSLPFVHPTIRQNSRLYPASQDFHRFYTNTMNGPGHQRLMNRLMLKFRTDRWR